MDKKGQVGFGSAQSALLALVLIAFIIGAGVIGMAAMKSNSPTNADNTSDVNVSLDNSITGLVNFSAQIPTVGIMLGIGLILLVILGVFGFGKRGGL
jgi:hypothetical protein